MKGSTSLLQRGLTFPHQDSTSAAQCCPCYMEVAQEVPAVSQDLWVSWPNYKMIHVTADHPGIRRGSWRKSFHLSPRRAPHGVTWMRPERRIRSHTTLWDQRSFLTTLLHPFLGCKAARCTQQYLLDNCFFPWACHSRWVFYFPLNEGLLAGLCVFFSPNNKWQQSIKLAITSTGLRVGGPRFCQLPYKVRSQSLALKMKCHLGGCGQGSCQRLVLYTLRFGGWETYGSPIWKVILLRTSAHLIQESQRIGTTQEKWASCNRFSSIAPLRTWSICVILSAFLI